MKDAAKYNIPSARRGETWPGMTMRINRNLTGWRVRMWVVPEAGKDKLLEFDSNNETITLEPDSEYSYIVWPPMIITLRPGRYNYDIEFTSSTGVVQTLVEGTWTIINDVTK